MAIGKKIKNRSAQAVPRMIRIIAALRESKVLQSLIESNPRDTAQPTKPNNATLKLSFVSFFSSVMFCGLSLLLFDLL